jgi:hypothetical protein
LITSSQVTSTELQESVTQLVEKDVILLCNQENFSIACWQYGEADKVTVFQATGGMTGDYIKAYLDELHIHHVTSNY